MRKENLISSNFLCKFFRNFCSANFESLFSRHELQKIHETEETTQNIKRNKVLEISIKINDNNEVVNYTIKIMYNTYTLEKIE